MRLRQFLLDHWIDDHAEPPPEFNLALSTGPRWRLRELLELTAPDALDRLLDLEVIYSRTAGASSLREAIAKMQGVPADKVVVLTGGAEALLHIFFLAAEPGANVIIPFPNFPSHQVVPESLGLEVRCYHLRRENSYRIDFDEVKRLADAKTKLLLVNSPHNPTGATLSDAEMTALHDFAAERRIQFVSDEVFHPVYHGRETASAARLPHVTVVGDFSKAFSLSGLRLGWIVERDPQRRKEYLNAREYFTVSNTPMAEFLAEIAVHHRDKVLGLVREVTRANLQVLDLWLAEHADILDWVRPQGGMTGFPRLVSGADSRKFCQEAAARAVLLAPGDCWGMPSHFRLGFGTCVGRFSEALNRLDDCLTQYSRREPDLTLVEPRNQP